jgi:uncharacterized protein GlcG (DUF336 family)
MSGKIILPFGNNEEPMVKVINRAIKERRGKSQAFVCAIINEDGTATVVTNMDRQPQIVELLTDVLRSVKGN